MLNTMTPNKITPENLKLVIDEVRRRRNQEIRRLYAAYKADPITGWTLEKIAKRYRLTKQRIQQIVKEESSNGADPH